MEKKGALSKILAVVGNVLVWFPILAPLVLGFISLGVDGIYRLEYLMPAELGILVFIGVPLLIWGAIRTGSGKISLLGDLAWPLDRSPSWYPLEM